MYQVEGGSSSCGGDDQGPGMAAMLLLQKDEICAGVVGVSKGAGQRSSGGLRERECEKFCTRIVRAGEELKRGQMENESLMKTLNKYKVWVRNLKKMLEEEVLNGMAVLPEVKELRQDVERLDMKKKLL